MTSFVLAGGEQIAVSAFCLANGHAPTVRVRGRVVCSRCGRPEQRS